MLLLVYTVVSAQQAGWASARTIGSFALVAAGLAAFVTIESRSRDPLMPLQIFRSGPLRRANIGAVTLFGSYVSFQFLATQYLQSLAGWSPISTALAFLPAGVMVAVLSVSMGGLLGRFGTGKLAAAAFACLVAAYAVFLRAGVTPDYPSVMLPTMLLVGLAFGLGFSALSVAATDGMPNERAGPGRQPVPDVVPGRRRASARRRHRGGRRGRRRARQHAAGHARRLPARALPDHRRRGGRRARRPRRACGAAATRCPPGNWSQNRSPRPPRRRPAPGAMNRRR